MTDESSENFLRWIALTEALMADDREAVRALMPGTRDGAVAVILAACSWLSVTSGGDLDTLRADTLRLDLDTP